MSKFGTSCAAHGTSAALQCRAALLVAYWPAIVQQSPIYCKQKVSLGADGPVLAADIVLTAMRSYSCEHAAALISHWGDSVRCSLYDPAQSFDKRHALRR